MPNDIKNAVPEDPAPDLASLTALSAIALRCADRPIASILTDGEILGYDEFGAPAR